MKKLKKRKNLRIPEYDYSTEGYYFVTICTKERIKILSKIVGADEPVRPEKNNHEIENKNVGADDPVRPKKEYTDVKNELTEIGKIVENYWQKINDIYENVTTDKFVIMPNHIHGIIKLQGRTESSAPTKDNSRI